MILNQIALKSATRLGDDLARISTHYLAGLAAMHSGAYDDAITHFSAAKAICDVAGLSPFQQALLRRMSTCLLRTGRIPEALGHGQQALAICR